MREASVLTGVYTLKQQLETTKIEQVKESAYVLVLDYPRAPLKYSYPKEKTNSNYNWYYWNWAKHPLYNGA